MAARNRIALILAATVVVATVGVGCGDRGATGPENRTDPSMGTQQPAQKSGTGERRSDLGPLTSRFSALPTPARATWYSGTLGRDAAPGPSSYWVDAVVELSREDVDALTQEYAPEAAAREPNVVADLRDDVPDGPLLAGDELDRAFSTAGFVSHVWLDVEGRRLVLTATGQ